MKQFFIIVVVTAAVIGCSKPINQTHSSGPAKLASTVIDTVQLGSCANPVFETETVKICFDSLLTDCRCPKNVVCIWAGYAAGKFSFTQNNQTTVFSLSATRDFNTTYSTSTIISGYKIEFPDLLPYPDALDPSSSIPANKKAVLRITKL
jgi:hypothetical protein